MPMDCCASKMSWKFQICLHIFICSMSSSHARHCSKPLGKAGNPCSHGAYRLVGVRKQYIGIIATTKENWNGRQSDIGGTKHLERVVREVLSPEGGDTGAEPGNTGGSQP